METGDVKSASMGAMGVNLGIDAMHQGWKVAARLGSSGGDARGGSAMAISDCFLILIINLGGLG